MLRFVLDKITFYSLLGIFNNSSEIVRTKGMKNQLCVIFPASVIAFLVARRCFAVSGTKGVESVHLLRNFFTFLHFYIFHTAFHFTLTNYPPLLYVENSDVAPFHDCHYIERSHQM